MSIPPHGPDRSSYARGVVLLLLAGTVWSMMGLGVRYIENASPLQILLYRSLGMIPALALFIAWRHGGRLDRAVRQMGTPTILGGLALVFAFCGSIVSLKETTVANAVFLLATAPFFAAILGRIVLREKVRLTTWITILVGSFGIVIMVYDGLSAGKVVGNVAGLVCAVFFAVFTIAMRAEKHGDTVPAVLLGGIYASIASGIAATVAGKPLVLAPMDAAIAVALGAGSLGFGLILYALASRHVPAAESTLLAMTEVVLSPIWVWLILGETAGPLMLVGGGILLAALLGNAIIGVVRERRMARADERSAHVGQRHGNGHAAPHLARPVHPGLAGPRPVRYPAATASVQHRSFRR
jgi:drug/metabolite transporter (DMT)-like permease